MRKHQPPKPNPGGRVNIDLGPQGYRDLHNQSKATGLSKTRIAKLLILSGLDRMQIGKLAVIEAKIEEVSS